MNNIFRSWSPHKISQNIIDLYESNNNGKTLISSQTNKHSSSFISWLKNWKVTITTTQIKPKIFGRNYRVEILW